MTSPRPRPPACTRTPQPATEKAGGAHVCSATEGVGRPAGGEAARDDRDHRLRRRRADGCEHRSDGSFGKLELPPEPLDPVREQLGTEQDDHKRERQNEQLHDQAPAAPNRIPTPTTTRTRTATPAKRGSPARAKP